MDVASSEGIVFRRHGENGAQASQSIERRTRSLISKVTRENYSAIASQLAAIEVNTAAEFEPVARLLVCKTLREPAFLKSYVHMIRDLTSQWRAPEEHGDNMPPAFLQLILQQCKREFEDPFSTYLQEGVEGASYAFCQPMPGGPAPQAVLRPDGVSFETDNVQSMKQHKAFLASAKFAGMLFLVGVAPFEFLDHIVTCLVKQRIPGGKTVEDQALATKAALPDVFFLGGARSITQPAVDDTALSFLVRVADELDVAPRLLRLVEPAGAVLPPSARLVEHGDFADSDEHGVRKVLQVVMLPDVPNEGFVECLCGLVDILTESSTAVTVSQARFAPLTAPQSQAMSPAITLDMEQQCQESRAALVQRCRDHLVALDKDLFSKRIQFQIEAACEHAEAWQGNSSNDLSA